MVLANLCQYKPKYKLNSDWTLTLRLPSCNNPAPFLQIPIRQLLQSPPIYRIVLQGFCLEIGLSSKFE
ncbi:hypothetical protein ACTXT7_010650 [Hymenolepis weldensis]